MKSTRLATSLPIAVAEDEAAHTQEGGVRLAAPKARSGLSLRANFSWTFVGHAVDAGSWWLMTVVLAKLGSPEHVGQFALGLAVTAPIFTFATMRLRDVQATDAKQEFVFADYFAMRITTTLLAVLAVLAVIGVSGYQGAAAAVILATAASKGIEALSDNYYGLFMQHERLDHVAKSMIIKGPLALLGLGLGFYLTGSVFWGVAGLATARALVVLGYDSRNAALCLNPSSNLGRGILPRGLPRPHWDRRTLSRLAWLTLPLGLVSMLMSFGSNIPRYFIGGSLGSYQLGIFVAITAFQKTAPTVIQALGRSACPRLAKYYVAQNVRAFRKLALGLVVVGLGLGTAGVLVAWVAGRQILTLLYGPEYALPRVLVAIMISAGLDYVATMLLFVVTAARYFGVQLPLQLLMTGAVAVACYVLVPTAGLEGAAWAMVISDVVRAVGALGAALYAQHALERRSKSGPQTSAAG